MPTSLELWFNLTLSFKIIEIRTSFLGILTTYKIGLTLSLQRQSCYVECFFFNCYNSEIIKVFKCLVSKSNIIKV